MNQRTALGVIAGIGALAVVSAAVAVFVSMPRLAGPIPTLSPAEALSPDQRAGFAKLQLDSRPMALAIEPDEVAYGHVVSVDSARADVVADRARALGLRPVISDEELPSVSFSATRSTILEIAALPEVANAWIEEDVAANRGISHPLPAGTQFPVPGMPYAETGLAVDASELAIRGDRLRGRNQVHDAPLTDALRRADADAQDAHLVFALQPGHEGTGLGRSNVNSNYDIVHGYCS